MILKSILRKIILVIGVLLIPFFANAQVKKHIEYSGFFDTYYFRGPTIFTLGTGLNLYNGDLCGGFGCNKLSPNVSFGVGYQVWPGVVFGGEVTYLKLGATDSNKDRGISFTSSNYELMGFSRYYLRRDIIRRHTDMFKRPKVFKPYVMLGLAGLVYNPNATYADTTGTIVAVDESYDGITFAIPAGIGASFVISHRIQIITELTYRYTFSDYLDGVGEKFGNSSVKDNFFTFNVKIGYAPLAPRLKKKKRKYSPASDSNSEEGGSGGGGGGGEAAPKKAAPETTTPVDEPVDEIEDFESPSDEEIPMDEIPFEEETTDEESFDDWK